jgi:hypothetical protein
LHNKYFGQVLIKRVLGEILGNLVLCCCFLKTGLHNILFGLKADSHTASTFERPRLGQGERSAELASQVSLMIPNFFSKASDTTTAAAHRGCCRNTHLSDEHRLSLIYLLHN